MTRAIRTNSLEADAVDQEPIMSAGAAKLDSAALASKETWHANCPVVSASSVDEALGWARDELQKIGVQQHCQRLFWLPIAD
jgi:hypothetical protein